mmetsp:Transcript_51890/g.121388  ORF Transcript_51890/g.121388 Transcript_51890/m.121388 type:complete len:478 (+) Transcript_51890:92-1525(+)
MLSTGFLNVDVMVTEFSCKDSSVLTSLGDGCTELRWKLQVGSEVDPLEIKVHIDEGDAACTKVAVMTAKGFQMSQLFPNRHACDGDDFAFSAPLKRDFEHRWSFKGRLPGLTVPKFYQFMPFNLDEWFDATIMRQLPDDMFEVVAFMPDATGKLKQVGYSDVSKEDLREAKSQRPLEVPVRYLELKVPATNSRSGIALLLDGKESITHRFVRPSPPPVIGDLPQSKRNALRVQVTKDRTLVTCNDSEAVLRDFLSQTVRRGARNQSATRQSWVIHVGPFCSHKIELESRSSEVAAIRIDDVPCITASSEVLGCDGSFSCQIRLVGDKTLLFQVFMVNVDGHTLDATGSVSNIWQYVCTCELRVRSFNAPLEASLLVNGVDFQDLHAYSADVSEEGLELDPDKFREDYGITVPYKVDIEADTDFQSFAKRLIGLGPENKDGASLFGLFDVLCCRRPAQETQAPVYRERTSGNQRLEPM